MVYGLLIGINDYPLPVQPLSGPVNDILRFRAWLTSTVPQEECSISILLNEQATRDAVIHSFRNHLARATQEDTVIFYFAGHGSRQRSAPEFKSLGLSSENLDETILCYDSRCPGSFDMADKEIAALISESIPEATHTIAIFDCCHAAGITRLDDNNLRSRREKPLKAGKSRPLTTYLDGYFVKQMAQDKLKIPHSNHFVLSACDRTQLAFESNGSGLFSNALKTILESYGPDVSLSILFRDIRELISFQLINSDHNQNPRLDLLGHTNSNCCFISGKKAPPNQSTRTYLDGNSVWVDLGLKDGLNSMNCNSLATFDRWGREKAKIKIIRIEPGRCLLNLPSGVKHRISRLKPLWLTKKNLPIAIDLESGISIQLKRKILKMDLSGIVLKLTSQPEFKILFRFKEFQIVRTQDEKDILSRTKTPSETEIKSIFSRIVQWKNLINMKGSGLGLDQITLKVELGDQTLQIENDQTEFICSPDQKESIPIRITANSQDSRPLYFSLIYFSDRYRIHVFPTEFIPPRCGDLLLYGEGPEDHVSIPQGEKEAQFRLRLLVSEQRPDLHRLSQPEISREQKNHSHRNRNPFKGKSESNTTMGEWALKDLTITLKG